MWGWVLGYARRRRTPSNQYLGAKLDDCPRRAKFDSFRGFHECGRTGGIPGPILLKVALCTEYGVRNTPVPGDLELREAINSHDENSFLNCHLGLLSWLKPEGSFLLLCPNLLVSGAFAFQLMFHPRGRLQMSALWFHVDRNAIGRFIQRQLVSCANRNRDGSSGPSFPARY